MKVGEGRNRAKTVSQFLTIVVKLSCVEQEEEINIFKKVSAET